MPNIPDKKDWRVFGQTLDITLPLEDPVSVIKAKIHEVTNMPPGKQKLNMEVGFSSNVTFSFWKIVSSPKIYRDLLCFAEFFL